MKGFNQQECVALTVALANTDAELALADCLAVLERLGMVTQADGDPAEIVVGASDAATVQ